jgi:hypothetical protein
MAAFPSAAPSICGACLHKLIQFAAGFQPTHLEPANLEYPFTLRRDEEKLKIRKKTE